MGSEVELKIWVGDIGLKMNAIVRTSDPGVGNGMEFMGLDEQGAKTLADYFAKLEGSPAPAEPSIRDLLIM